MGLFAPVFLTANLDRVNTLRQRYSDSTVAGIINDENGTSFTGAQIAAYADISNMAAKRMLVPQVSMNVLTKDPATEPQAA